MRYRFQSTAPQPAMTDQDLVVAAAELCELLKDDPVLGSAVVTALTKHGALGIVAFVHSNPDRMAAWMAMDAAHEALGQALKDCGFEDDDRTGSMRLA